MTEDNENAELKLSDKCLRYLIDPIHLGIQIAVNLVFTGFILDHDARPSGIIDDLSTIIILMALLNLYFLCHTILTVVCLGPSKAWKFSKTLYYELFLITACLIYLLFTITKNDRNHYKTYQVLTLVVILRNMRIFHFLTEN